MYRNWGKGAWYETLCGRNDNYISTISKLDGQRDDLETKYSPS